MMRKKEAITNQVKFVELKNTVPEMKNLLNGIESRLHNAEEKTSQVENLAVKTIWRTEKKKEIMKNREPMNYGTISSSLKQYNYSPRRRRTENIFEEKVVETSKFY